MMDRRSFLKGALTAALAPGLSGCRRHGDEVRWTRDAYRKEPRSRIAVLQAKDYTANLTDKILDGIGLFSLDVSGKSVVLKPNLVEYDPDGVINTHPRVIAAAVEAFRRSGARKVTVAEGPGHRRDNEYLLTASGLFDVLREFDVDYVDLNNDDSRRVTLPTSYTPLGSLYLPATVLDADLLVSMPKMKTHHWAGVTLSLKNMFGIVPGSIYGWPKNPLHWAGIPQSIVDINACLAMPRFAIVDGIVAMEGNGPIQGQARNSGVLVFGQDPVAVDATAARLMGMDPRKMRFLELASQFLGNVERDAIDQLGADPETLVQDFAVLESFKSLKEFSG
jgi:uncharacterized protein (DUF362 family)